MDSGFDIRIQLVAIAITALIFLVILELVRRRRLVERYALLWMVAAIALLTLAVWRGLLDVAATLLGVADPPNALFLVAFGVVFVLLLHFSVATSRLAEETKILAQEVARLDHELRVARQGGANGEPTAEIDDSSADQDRTPSSASTADQ